MRISVITVVLNDPRVGRALASILAQEVDAETELIVIDGGSSDERTLEELERYRRHLSVFLSEPDQGLYDAMNKGLRYATGDIIGFLNADDRYADRSVLRDVAAAFADPSIEACYGDVVYTSRQDERIIRYWRAGTYKRWKYYWGWMPTHLTFFARRSVYERLGHFDLAYPIAADYDLMLRFLFLGNIRVHYIPRILVCMDAGGTSNDSLRAIVRGNWECWQIWKKHGLTLHGILVPLVKPLRKVGQFLRRPPAIPEVLRAQSAARTVTAATG
ncbi:MAG: glycosyltransferase [Candidatus Kapabacteria bacterium]|nr:glycosyltransferase [Candidatus Kapabacteria bacterium]MCS7169335.1 glycosyltransferase [Candidatus Kapabacteria bacterium]MDW7996925.1 glycosyltransferase family 2 protein [Bacteroidota bacterium]MDW8224820.1 glycosyltransferase family 2 protein [Bacteroidota bacterium]